MSNFYIGQEVVALQSRSESPLKKGNIYTIEGIRREKCACGCVLVNIGHVNLPDRIGKFLLCQYCGKHDGVHDGYWWYDELLFAPLQTKSEESDMEESIKEALEKPLFV